MVCVSALKTDENVPVLIFQRTKWISHGDNTVTIGQNLKSEDFLAKLGSIKANVDIILVDELNSQDLRGLLKENQDNVHYEPAVESAFPTLKTFVDVSQIETKIEDFKMDTIKALEAFKARQDSSDVVILTGLKTRKIKENISKRAADDEEQSIENSVQVFGDNCAAVFNKIYLVDNTDDATKSLIRPLSVTGSKFLCDNKTSTLTLKIAQNTTVLGGTVTEVTLKLSQTSNQQYWALESGSLSTSAESLGVTYMGAPYGMETPNMFSFVCTRTYFQLFNATMDKKPLVKVAMYIEGLQIQPYGMMMGGNSTSEYMFGKINYCQGFFTSGIWMAIISSLLLIFITMSGVTLLANINTMDRFDDPKGKPLNIALEK